MGNRALRKQLGEKVGRFFTGHKLGAFKVLHADRLRVLLSTAVEPGGLLHDCDGFNHVVEKTEHIWVKQRNWRGYPGIGNAEMLQEIDILFADGGIRCQCGDGSARPPAAWQAIEKWFLSWIEYQRKSGTGWADGPYYDEILRRLKNGERVTDDFGCELPQLRELRRSEQRQME